MIVFFFFYNMIPCSLSGTGLSPPSSPLGGRNRRRRRHHILLVLPRNPLIHSSQLVPRGHLCECTDGGNTLGASTCMMTIIHDDLNTFQEKLEHILHTKERECLSSANQSSNNGKWPASHINWLTLTKKKNFNNSLKNWNLFLTLANLYLLNVFLLLKMDPFLFKFTKGHWHQEYLLLINLIR